MKIYTFTNIINNYCSGHHYFAADNLEEAKLDADSFASHHNISVDNNRNYTIEWGEDPQELEPVRGFLPLNRTYTLQKPDKKEVKMTKKQREREEIEQKEREEWRRRMQSVRSYNEYDDEGMGGL